MIVSCLEGARLVARLYGDLDMFRTIAANLSRGSHLPHRRGALVVLTTDVGNGVVN